MKKKIAEQYFLFKCVEGNYNTIDMNAIWDDIYNYISRNKLYTDYEEDLAHISILHNHTSKPYLEIGFLISDYMKPNNDITIREIKGGHFEVIEQKGVYKEKDIDTNLVHYRKHLNSVDETLPDYLNSEIYILSS